MYRITWSFPWEFRPISMIDLCSTVVLDVCNANKAIHHPCQTRVCLFFLRFGEGKVGTQKLLSYSYYWSDACFLCCILNTMTLQGRRELIVQRASAKHVWPKRRLSCRCFRSAAVTGGYVFISQVDPLPTSTPGSKLTLFSIASSW